MELIVVIVILAILAAILIPGLLKWIDQAKDKKYELEARGIAQAAEAALTKMYAQGTGVLEQLDGTKNLMDNESFKEEIGKFTDATKINEIKIDGDSDGSGSWGGSVSSFEIDFTSDGVPITAELSSDTDNRWIINGSSDGTGGESSDELDKYDDDNLYVREANAIAKAAMKAMAKVYADDGVYVQEAYHGRLYFGGTPGVYSGKGNFMELGTFVQEIAKSTNLNVENINYINSIGPGFSTDDWDDQLRPWDGSVSGFYIGFVSSSDGVNIRASYLSGPTIDAFGGTGHYLTDGWQITKS